MTQTLGDRIRHAREFNRVTQRDASTSLGYSKRQFIRYEQGDVLPGRATLERMATMFGVEYDWLKFGTGRAPWGRTREAQPAVRLTSKNGLSISITEVGGQFKIASSHPVSMMHDGEEIVVLRAT